MPWEIFEMYTATNTIKYILEEVPSFKFYFEQKIKDWSVEERTIGIDISFFSDFISDKLKNNEDFDFKKTFDVVEKLLIEGDKEVSIAIGLQFLENLINASSSGDFSIDSAIKYLGKESKAFCKANEEFWGIKNSKFYEDK